MNICDCIIDTLKIILDFNLTFIYMKIVFVCVLVFVLLDNMVIIILFNNYTTPHFQNVSQTERKTAI